MKILYVTTIGSTMNFFKAFIKRLIDDGNKVDIATNEKESKVPECYREWGCEIHQLSCLRSPFKSGNIKAVSEIKKLVEDNKYDIVHCHTPIAAACTRFACIKAREKGTRVFYTAHGFHFYKGAPLKNWLIYYPVEWLCSFFTDTLITINQEDFEIAKKHMHAKRTEYVPGVGVDINKFKNAVVNKDQKRESIGVPRDAILLLSVGELNENKNHQIVVKALAQIGDSNIHYVIAGVGDKKDYLLELAKELGVDNQLHLLGYRKDVAELYKVADIFCFPSIREGLGLAAIEAMASGLPVIAADNRGTRSFIENKELIFSPYEVEECINCIKRVLPSNKAVSTENYSSKVENFEIGYIIEKMKNIYQ